MKYQPLRLVSWVNSTQCSFKPIKRLQMSNINGHHQPAGFGLVLKCHLRCIFWEQQIDTLEIYILVCLHYVSKSNPRNLDKENVSPVATGSANRSTYYLLWAFNYSCSPE